MTEITTIRVSKSTLERFYEQKVRVPRRLTNEEFLNELLAQYDQNKGLKSNKS